MAASLRISDHSFSVSNLGVCCRCQGDTDNRHRENLEIPSAGRAKHLFPPFGRTSKKQGFFNELCSSCSRLDAPPLKNIIKGRKPSRTRDQAPLEEWINAHLAVTSSCAQTCIIHLTKRAWSRLLNGFRGQAPKTKWPLGRGLAYRLGGRLFRLPQSEFRTLGCAHSDASDAYPSHLKIIINRAPQRGRSRDWMIVKLALWTRFQAELESCLTVKKDTHFSA